METRPKSADVLWEPKRLSMLSDHYHQTQEVVRIYSDGVYDLFHPGHVEQLRQAKHAFPNVHLLVGVCSDEDTKRHKGCLPVMNMAERCRMVTQCRYVDEIIEGPPFFPTLQFVNAIKVDLVAHDALPYNSPDSPDCYAVFKSLDRFFETHRTPAISTTELLDRILQNLDMFKMRQKCRNSNLASISVSPLNHAN